MAELALPSETYKDSFIAAVREFHAEDRLIEYDIGMLQAHFPAFVRWLRQKRDRPQPGRVAETYYWLVEDGEFIGRVSIRHELTPSLEQIGGHIGYEIRPTKRRRGYGTLILKLALDAAREIGLRRVLVTCADDNLASARIIEANGGELQDKIWVAGRTVQTRRYWIEVK